MGANIKNFNDQGGAKQTIGGELHIDAAGGGKVTIDALDITAALGSLPPAASVLALASGKKMAWGEVTLDGSNPTPIVTGLATVEACTVALKAAATPGDDPTSFSVNYGGAVTAGSVNLYAYKTDGTDPTLVPSTNNAAVVSWIAVGT
jgi:hypothetical protein